MTLTRGITEIISFHNELDLLEAHLEEHKNLVQRTIIAESRTDVAGREKPLYARDNLSRFDRFDIELVESPAHLNEPMLPDTETHYRTFRSNENARRTWNHTQHNINTTWVLNSDVDEILDPKHFDEWLPGLLDSDDQKACIFLRQYMHQVDCRAGHQNAWRFFRSDLSPEQIRAGAHKKVKKRRLHSATDGGMIGWHFTNCAATAKDIWEKAKVRPWLFKVDRPEDVPGIEHFESLMGKQVYFMKYPARPLPRWRKEDPKNLPVWMAANLDKFPTIPV
jgi:hypothetical protein